MKADRLLIGLLTGFLFHLFISRLVVIDLTANASPPLLSPTLYWYFVKDNGGRWGGRGGQGKCYGPDVGHKLLTWILMSKRPW